MVKSLGAVEAYDYHSDSCGADILAYTRNNLKYAFDCITDIGSMRICYTALGGDGGKYVALDPFPIRGHTRRKVEPNWIMAFTIWNKPVSWTGRFRMDAKPRDREFAEAWFKQAQKMLNEGSIVPPRHEEQRGGLKGVIQGMDLMRKGMVSGRKLVYKVQDE
jgi:aspyridone synthetase trans-acting enoyl reductase